jgi:hypothetical protein
VTVNYCDDGRQRRLCTFPAHIDSCPGTIGTLASGEPLEGLLLRWDATPPTWDGQPNEYALAFLGYPGDDGLALLYQADPIMAAVLPTHLAYQPEGWGLTGKQFAAVISPAGGSPC